MKIYSQILNVSIRGRGKKKSSVQILSNTTNLKHNQLSN